LCRADRAGGFDQELGVALWLHAHPAWVVDGQVLLVPYLPDPNRTIGHGRVLLPELAVEPVPLNELPHITPFPGGSGGEYEVSVHRGSRRGERLVIARRAASVDVRDDGDIAQRRPADNFVVVAEVDA
jgi:hypothetical protein